MNKKINNKLIKKMNIVLGFQPRTGANYQVCEQMKPIQMS